MAESQNIVQLTDATFDAEVVQSPLPVLIDFWAPWCGPCRAIAPIVAEVADAYAGRVKVGKINVDEDTRVAAMHNISAIPTLLLFKGGQVVEQLVGAVPKNKLVALLDRHL